MKPTRSGVALSLLGAGALLLSACGSDDNVPVGSARDVSTAGDASATGECGGKKSLRASGATAQANAMTRFVNAYETDCPGYPIPDTFKHRLIDAVDAIS